MKARIIITLSIFTTTLFGQNKDFQYATYDICFNGIISGISSNFHKKENEKFAKTFATGFYRGAIGGVIQFSSKKIVQQITLQENYWYGISGKLVNSIGTSVVSNSMLNKSMFSNYSIDIWFVHFQTNFKKSEIKLNPVTSGCFTYFLIDKRFHFSFIKSIQTGVLYFEHNFSEYEFRGISLSNVISIYPKELFKVREFDKLRNKYVTRIYTNNLYSNTSHEIIHTYQFTEYLNFNNFIPIKSIKYINYDIPYYGLPYILFKESFEKEARYFSN